MISGLIPIQVIMNDDSEVPPLLGRAEFFDRYKITFKQKIGRVVLKKEETRRRRF